MVLRAKRDGTCVNRKSLASTGRTRSTHARGPTLPPAQGLNAA